MTRKSNFFRIFAQNLFKHVKVANMTSVHNQITMTWNNLNWQFRGNISKSTEFTIIRHFFDQFDNHVDIWFKMTNTESESKRLYDRKFFNNKSYYQNYEQNSTSNRDNFNSYRVFFKTNNVYHNNLQNRNYRSSRMEVIIKIKRKILHEQNFSMSRHDLNDRKYRKKSKIYRKW